MLNRPDSYISALCDPPEMSLHDSLALEIQRLLLASPNRQEDLAEATGFTQASISNWTRGRRRPTIQACQQVADALDMQVVVALAPKGDAGAALMRLAGGMWHREEVLELVELLEQAVPNLEPSEIKMLVSMIRGVRDSADKRLRVPHDQRASLDEEE